MCSILINKGFFSCCTEVRILNEIRKNIKCLYHLFPRKPATIAKNLEIQPYLNIRAHVTVQKITMANFHFGNISRTSTCRIIRKDTENILCKIKKWMSYPAKTKIFPVASKNTHKIWNVKQQLGTVSYRRNNLVCGYFANRCT